MSVTVKFSCGGCDATAEGTTFLRQRTELFTPLNAIFGLSAVDVQAVAPEGWVAFDPYTGCCYCPKCWKEIMSDDKEER